MTLEVTQAAELMWGSRRRAEGKALGLAKLQTTEGRTQQPLGNAVPAKECSGESEEGHAGLGREPATLWHMNPAPVIYGQRLLPQSHWVTLKLST